MHIDDAIDRALADGKALSVKYHGGSQPGTVRKITPLARFGDKIRAECHVTGMAKVFRIDKLELFEGAGAAPEYRAESQPAEFTSLEDFHAHHRDTLEGLGWFVKFESGDDHARLSLHRWFKNGKLRKTADVKLSFTRYADEGYFDGEEWVTTSPPRERTRPFRVDSGKDRGDTFGKLDRAIVVFLEAAESLADDLSD